MNRPTCSTCRFFYGIVDRRGACRRSAPVPQPRGPELEKREETIAVWPLVFADDWCGEHETPAELEMSRKPPTCPVCDTTWQGSRG